MVSWHNLQEGTVLFQQPQRASHLGSPFHTLIGVFHVIMQSEVCQLFKYS